MELLRKNKYLKNDFLVAGVLLSAVGLYTLFRGGPPSDFPTEPYSPPAQMPQLGQAKLLEGVKFYNVALDRQPEPSQLYVYLPNKTNGKPLPCVLIAPAGSSLFHGMKLAEGDQAEHIPYVKAGYAVVAYELDGALAENAEDDDIIKAAVRFQGAKAGLENAKTALNFALARIPGIDKKRIFTAGHSSAGATSLIVAQHEPRIKACIAYAPSVDPETWIGPVTVNAFNDANGDYKNFIHEYSPINATEKLRCPTFVFHANDDKTVKKADVKRFVDKLKLTNNQVNFVEVPSGRHYDSMIEQGIPQGIEWLNQQI